MMQVTSRGSGAGATVDMKISLRQEREISQFMQYRIRFGLFCVLPSVTEDAVVF